VLPITRNYILVYIYGQEPWASGEHASSMLHTHKNLLIYRRKTCFFYFYYQCHSLFLYFDNARSSLPLAFFRGNLISTRQISVSEKMMNRKRYLRSLSSRFLIHDFIMTYETMRAFARSSMVTDQSGTRLPKRAFEWNVSLCHYRIVLSKSIKV